MWRLIKKILIWFLESGNDEVFEKAIRETEQELEQLKEL